MPNEIFEMLASNLLAAKEWCLREAEETDVNNANERIKSVYDDLFLIMSIMNNFISDEYEQTVDSEGTTVNES